MFNLVRKYPGKKHSLDVTSGTEMVSTGDSEISRLPDTSSVKPRGSVADGGCGGGGGRGWGVYSKPTQVQSAKI